jgi:hypothetical protein
MPMALSQASEFLDRYRKFSKSIERDRFQNVISNFDRLKRGLEDVLDIAYEHERATASRFNVLELVGLQRDEATHSKLLSHMLNPNGSHGQGPLLLNSFLRFCESKVSGFPPILEREITRRDFVYVRAEFYSVYGRPDILAFCRNPKFAVVIENKIDAGDQEQQLERYWNLLESEFSFVGQRRALLYLTPSGRPPERTSEIPAHVHYLCMSYRTDLTGWLRSCVGGLPPGPQQFLMQYADIATSLATEQELQSDADE